MRMGLLHGNPQNPQNPQNPHAATSPASLSQSLCSESQLQVKLLQKNDYRINYCDAGHCFDEGWYYNPFSLIPIST